MNRIILIGNLTKDPELSETSSGISVCKFSLAVRRARANAEGNHETDFFSCTAWRGLAETIERYVRKGDKLGVVGEVQFRKYTDNQGVKKTSTNVIVQEIDFCGGKRVQESDSEGGRDNTRERNKTRQKPVLQDIDDDSDIPF